MAKSSKSKAVSVITAHFEPFWTELSAKELRDVFPTSFQYKQLRDKTVGKTKDIGEVVSELSQGWTGVQHIVQILWKNYLGDKFGSQMLANFVFRLLLSGVEEGWNAVVKYVKTKLGDDTPDDIASIVQSLNTLFVEHRATEIFDEIKALLTSLDTTVNATTTQNGEVEKPNIFRKILRGVAWLLKKILGF